MQFFCIYYGNIFKNEESEKDKNKDKSGKINNMNSNSDKVTLNDRLRENKVI
jgi:hypothetical protein